MTAPTARERVLGGLWGAVVGDAIGVPVEFTTRAEREADPVGEMRGWGTYSQPPGTWSDDSSLLLCTVEWLLGRGALDDLGALFVRWLDEAHWTPRDNVFDVGNATRGAIDRLRAGVPAMHAGGADERSNGNGSLMRILPVALWHLRADAPTMLRAAHDASALTHAHPRSQFACGYYCLLARMLADGVTPVEAYQQANRHAADVYEHWLPFAEELPHLQRLMDGGIATLPVESISSSGYVIHTLEAAVWCVLATQNYAEAVLRAVNLGEDTDTVACVTGGLAGLAYRLNAIPDDWLSAIQRRQDVDALLEQFADAGGQMRGRGICSQPRATSGPGVDG